VGACPGGRCRREPSSRPMLLDDVVIVAREVVGVDVLVAACAITGRAVGVVLTVVTFTGLPS